MPRAASPQNGSRGRVPLDVVDDEEVQAAVVVVVEPGGRDRPVMALEAGCAGYVLEGAVAAIVEQGVAVDAGDEQVGEAVVVIVARGDADVVACAAHSGFVGDVLEGPVVAVAVEAIAILRAGLFERWLFGAVGEIDVGIAVVIVVEDGDAAGHGFDLVLLGRGGVAQHEGDAGMGGAVLEEGPGGAAEGAKMARARAGRRRREGRSSRMLRRGLAVFDRLESGLRPARFRRARNRYGPAGCGRGIRSKVARARGRGRLRPDCSGDTAREPIRSGRRRRPARARGPVGAQAGFRRRGSAGTETRRMPGKAARLHRRDPPPCGKTFPRHRTARGHPGRGPGFHRRGSAPRPRAGPARRPATARLEAVGDVEGAAGEVPGIEIARVQALRGLEEALGGIPLLARGADAAGQYVAFGVAGVESDGAVGFVERGLKLVEVQQRAAQEHANIGTIGIARQILAIEADGFGGAQRAIGGVGVGE